MNMYFHGFLLIPAIFGSLYYPDIIFPGSSLDRLSFSECSNNDIKEKKERLTLVRKEIIYKSLNTDEIDEKIVLFKGEGIEYQNSLSRSVDYMKDNMIFEIIPSSEMPVRIGNYGITVDIQVLIVIYVILVYNEANKLVKLALLERSDFIFDILHDIFCVIISFPARIAIYEYEILECIYHGLFLTTLKCSERNDIVTIAILENLCNRLKENHSKIISSVFRVGPQDFELLDRIVRDIENFED